MGIISIEKLKVGMLLKQEIRDRSGRLLLPAEAQVTDAAIRVLKMWGITDIHVQQEGEDDPTPVLPSESELDPHLLVEAETAVASQFIHADRASPFMAELFRLVTIEYARHLSKHKDGEA